MHQWQAVLHVKIDTVTCRCIDSIVRDTSGSAEWCYLLLIVLLYVNCRYLLCIEVNCVVRGGRLRASSRTGFSRLLCISILVNP